jgi:hypothetical protein
MAGRIGNWLTGFGCLVLFLAFFPSFSSQGGSVTSPLVATHLEDHPDAMPVVKVYSFGWLGSPLVSYRSEKTIAEVNGALSISQSNDLNIGWVSWSSLTLATGLTLLWAGKKLRGRAKAAITSPG